MSPGFHERNPLFLRTIPRKLKTAARTSTAVSICEFPLRSPSRSSQLHNVTLVLIMVTYPGHGVGKFIFVAALRHHIEIVIGPQKNVQPVRVCGIGVKDVAVCVP
jgi:hypothetical protein